MTQKQQLQYGRLLHISLEAPSIDPPGSSISARGSLRRNAQDFSRQLRIAPTYAIFPVASSKG